MQEVDVKAQVLERINLWWEIRKRVNCFSGKEESRRKALCLARFDDED